MSVSRSTLALLVLKELCLSLASANLLVFNSFRWTKNDESAGQLGLLQACHDFLKRVYKLWPVAVKHTRQRSLAPIIADAPPVRDESESYPRCMSQSRWRCFTRLSFQFKMVATHLHHRRMPTLSAPVLGWSRSSTRLLPRKQRHEASPRMGLMTIPCATAGAGDHGACHGRFEAPTLHRQREVRALDVW